MPTRFPKEFKDDVVRVAHSGKFTQEEIAHGFQISVASARRWVDFANIDDGLKDGLSSAELEENVRLRRVAAYFAHGALPTGANRWSEAWSTRASPSC